MDFNYLLLWIVGVSAASTVYRGIARGRAAKSSATVCISALLFALLWLFVYLIPNWAGFAIAFLWTLLLLVPGLAARRAQTLLSQQRASDALFFALLAKWLHPFGYFRDLPKMVRAYSLEYAGKQIEASRVFSELSRTAHPQLRSIATAQQFVTIDDWEGLVRWYRDQGRAPRQFIDSGVLALYLRALGETKRYDDLVAEFLSYESQLRNQQAHALLRVCQLLFFSFLGEVALVEELLKRSGKILPRDYSRFWMAYAQRAAGIEDEARKGFQALLESKTPLVRKRAEVQLATSASEYRPKILPETRRMFEQYISLMENDVTASGEEADVSVRPLASYVLIGANVVVYGLEIAFGGATNVEVLHFLGALYPPSVYELGEWWRVVTAGFLHAGFAHLSTNMLGIYILGPFVEERLGGVRFAVAFLASSILSFSAIVMFTYYGIQSPGIVVGASAGVLGLVGATATILVFDWMRHRHPSAAQRLKSIGFIIAIQVIFDLSTPEVSFFGHLGGLIAGMIVTVPLMLSTGRDT